MNIPIQHLFGVGAVGKQKHEKTKIKGPGGPYLAVAVFCESVLDDRSGKIGAVGILDTANYLLPHDAPESVPSDEQPVGISQTALLLFRSGDSPGKHKLKITVEAPDGKKTSLWEQDVTLSDPPHGGANVKTHMAMTVRSGGVFWFDVLLDGKRLTRMPLNITFQRVPAPPGAEPAKQVAKK